MACPVQRALLIAVAGVAIGLAGNAVSPRHILLRASPKVAPADADFISLADAQPLWQSGAAFFLDARAPTDYATGHIAGAFNLPVGEFASHYSAVAALLTPDSTLVTYCDGLQCDLSHDLTQRLRQLGYQHVRILQNGWMVWRKAGLATSTGNQP